MYRSIFACFLLASILMPVQGQSEPTVIQPSENGTHCVWETQTASYTGKFDPNTTPQSDDLSQTGPVSRGCYDTIAETISVSTDGQVQVSENATPTEIRVAVADYTERVAQESAIAAPQANDASSFAIVVPSLPSVPYIQIFEGNYQSPSNKSHILYGNGNCVAGANYHYVPDLRNVFKLYSVPPWESNNWDNDISSYEILDITCTDVFFYEDANYASWWGVGANNGVMKDLMWLWTWQDPTGWVQVNMDNEASSMVTATINW